MKSSQVKVYPTSLDPAKAPWSAPRGFTTTISDEANALKIAVRLSKVSQSKVAKGRRLKVEKVSGPSLWLRLINTLKCCTYKSNR